MVLEYSKWSEMFGYYGSGGYDPVLMRYFVQPPCFCRSLLPPDDYVSVVAYDMRPTPLTDFTNDPRRINEVINPCCGIHPRFARAICSMR